MQKKNTRLKNSHRNSFFNLSRANFLQISEFFSNKISPPPPLSRIWMPHTCQPFVKCEWSRLNYERLKGKTFATKWRREWEKIYGLLSKHNVDGGKTTHSKCFRKFTFPFIPFKLEWVWEGKKNKEKWQEVNVNNFACLHETLQLMCTIFLSVVLEPHYKLPQWNLSLSLQPWHFIKEFKSSSRVQFA